MNSGLGTASDTPFILNARNFTCGVFSFIFANEIFK